jgi:TRAP-type mannitol/chloroaromatic compound transport system permease small subunit
MRRPPRVLEATVHGIDRTVGEWSGRVFCWLILPLVVGLTYEVVVRKLFSAPTDWAFEITYMLYGSHFMLGVAYALYRGGHIRTDVFYSQWSPRTRGFVLVSSGNEAWLAWSIGERSDASPMRPLVWPFKAVIPVSALLVLIQGVSEFLKSAYAARSGRDLS